MEIKRVKTKEELFTCDVLLEKLVNDEKKYNKNIIDDIKINNYYENVYNKDDNGLFIALEDKIIVGYIFIKISADKTQKEKEAYIDALYIEEEYRNKGIGESLITKAKEYSSKLSCKYISINVMYQNEIAIKLYRKLGFSNFCISMKSKL